MDKLKMHTENKVDINIEKIGELFPDTLTEKIKGYDENNKPIIEKAIDFDILKQELSKVIVEGREERYQMNWPGKKEAILSANAPINKTLRPCREDSVDFDTTENLYIEGDNLEVLKLLQETYLNKIKMIYIDPPYNTGNDSFVYNDDFSMSNEEFSEASGQYDEDGNINYDIRKNSESNGRFHTDWLNMMYPRLKLAKDLLTDDGVIFISIGMMEVSNLEKVCNDIYGEQNMVGLISRVMKSGGGKGQFFSPNIDYILVYAKNKSILQKFRAPVSAKTLKSYYKNIEEKGMRKGQRYGEERIFVAGLDVRPNQRYWIQCPDGSYVIPEGVTRPSKVEEGCKVAPIDGDGCWKWTYETYLREKKLGNIVFKCTNTSPLVDENGKQSKYNLYNKVWLEDKEGSVPGDYIWQFENRLSSNELKELRIPFDFAKPIELIKYLIAFANKNKESIILDFFSGSSTTAHAVMKLNAEDGGNRKFIMVQLPEETDEKSEARKAGYENICEIGKERIRRAGKKIKEENPAVADKLDTGFRVLKLDSSNMKDVYYNPSDYNQDMIEALESNIKDDRSNEDLLFQVMLDLGELLSSDIKEINIQGKKVFNVGDGSIVACFDEDVTNDVLTDIAKMQPLYAVFRDSSFSNDSVATNFEQIFNTYSPNTIRKVL